MEGSYTNIYKKYVFIDESGNTSTATEKEGASSLYVPTAIVIDDADIIEANYKASKIREKFFNNVPIKSSSVSKEDKRIEILKAINDINFGYFFIVVDKTLIEKDSGLNYRSSFYKFINRQLYKNFLSINSKLKIYIDRYGSKEFQESFKAYIANKFDFGLFNEPEIKHLSGKDDNLIGVSDFLSGSIRLTLENKFKRKNEIVSLINRKCIYSTRWPIPKEFNEHTDIFKGFDNLIRDVSVGNAMAFIEQNIKETDNYKRMQSAVVTKLLSEITLDWDERKGLFTDELIKYLQGLNFKEISERLFRQKIIGPLRDLGILITGSNRGYYLAANALDIKGFLDHGNHIIIPMLQRIEKARDTLQKASYGQCDILSKQMGNADILKGLVNFIKNKKIGFIGSDTLEDTLYKVEQEQDNVPTEKLSE